MGVFLDGMVCGLVAMIPLAVAIVLLAGWEDLMPWLLPLGCLGVAVTAGTVASRAGCGRGFRASVGLLGLFLAIPLMFLAEWLVLLAFAAQAYVPPSGGSGEPAFSPPRLYAGMFAVHVLVALPVGGLTGLLFGRR